VRCMRHEGKFFRTCPDSDDSVPPVSVASPETAV
jgi:hypothetical protein